jgi:glutathione S-transferase
VRKAVIAIHEAGLEDEVEFETMRVSPSRHNPALYAINPLGKLPTLVLEDGTALYDSAVIVHYLDVIRGDGHLHPTDPDARFEVMRDHALGEGLMGLVVDWYSEKFRDEAADTAERFRLYEIRVNLTLDELETRASRLSRIHFNIAHIAIACGLGYLDFRFGDLDWRAGRPALAELGDHLNARPSVAATKPYDDI